MRSRERPDEETRREAVAKNYEGVKRLAAGDLLPRFRRTGATA